MKVLVTGAAGFIGSHTVEALLKRGDDVVMVDEVNDYYDAKLKENNIKICINTAAECNRQISFYQVDCANQVMNEIFSKEQPDLVCHLAARAGVRPSIQASFHLHKLTLGSRLVCPL